MTLSCFDLLEHIADGAFHSGNQLAMTMACSRTAIWQMINTLKQYGVDIFTVPGRGYRLASPIHLLSLMAIQTHLGKQADQYDIELVACIDSTNTTLAQTKWCLSEPRRVLVAEYQTAGRGRHARSWYASPGGSLTFSVSWPFQRGLAALQGLSLAVGIAVANALHQLGLKKTQLKWPNDILINDAKLGGILIEVQGDVLGPARAIIGIGLNVLPPKIPMVDPITPALPIASINDKDIDRNQLLAIILQHLERVLQIFATQGFAALKHDWNQYHAWHHQWVSITDHYQAQAVNGYCLGVDEDGALLIKTAQGIQKMISGDVSLRLRPEEQD